MTQSPLVTHHIGFVQFTPVLGAMDLNVERLFAFTRHHATACDLIVLPEMALTGYAFRDQAELGRIANRDNNGKTLEIARALSREFKGAAVVIGYPEWTEKGYFNSALMADENGLLGHYQKTHLFGSEKDLFLPGETGFRVFEFRNMQVGIMICFDWFFPESVRTLALRGATIIAHPTNLVMPYCQRAMFTRSLENSVYTVTANRCGTEMHQKELHFTGESVIYGPRGDILAFAPKTDDHVAVVPIDIQRGSSRQLNSRNNIFADRAISMYDLGSP